MVTFTKYATTKYATKLNVLSHLRKLRFVMSQRGLDEESVEIDTIVGIIEDEWSTRKPGPPVPYYSRSGGGCTGGGVPLLN